MIYGMNSTPENNPEKMICFLIMRLFFAQFWILQWFGKIFDQESHIFAWRNLAIWSLHTSEWFVKQTALPWFFVRAYTLSLPYLELVIGLLLLAGFQTRRVLVFSALLIISLDAGLLMQLKHDVVALNTIYLLAILAAVHLEKYNRWSLDSWLDRFLSGN